MYYSRTFVSACIDSDAEQSVIGLEQARENTELAGREIECVTSPLTFRLVDREKNSEGILKVRLPIPDGTKIPIHVHFVGADNHL